MPNTIHIAAELAAPAAEIFDSYLDPRAHQAITGAPVTVAPRAGAKFAAFDKALSGRILQLVPKRLIVQSWRASQWRPRDLDSTLILTLHSVGRVRTRIELVQVNVPDHDFAGVSQGWETYYWAPWRQYLKSRRVRPGTRAQSSCR
jgi:activator of HSP90 ATPase